MTISSSSAVFQQILELTASLDAADKSALVNELIKGSGLSIALSDLFHQSVSMQLNGLDSVGMADVMDAIAEAIRDRARAT